MVKKRILLFDLGGVLVEFVGFTEMTSWMKQPIPEREFARRWLLSPAASQFEEGRSSPPAFAHSLVNEFELQIDPNQFIEAFRGFIKGLYPGVREVLSGLSGDFTVASFSNTNELHWSKLCDETGIDRLIKTNFLSYQTGLVKPRKEAYLNVIAGLKCHPTDIYYFDDNPINVEMGESVGMHSYMVQGFAAVIPILNELIAPTNVSFDRAAN